MANSDIEIRILGKDMATPAFQHVSQEMDNAKRSADALGVSTSSLNNVLSNAAGYGMAIVGLNSLQDAFDKTVKSAYDFYSTMQTGSVSMAGTLMSVTKIGDKQLEWNDALKISQYLMNNISNAALRVGVSTSEMAQAFKAGLAPALKGGMNIDQYSKLLPALVAIGKTNGLNDTSIMRDVTDILSGTNITRTKMGNYLGITNSDITQARASGKEFEFLMDRIQGEVKSVDYYINTLPGRVNHLKEAIARISAEGLKNQFEGLTQVVADLANKMVYVDGVTGDVYINPDVLVTIQRIGNDADIFGQQIVKTASDVGSILNPALQVTGTLLEFAVNHAESLLEIYMAMVVGRKVSFYWTDYQNGLTGATRATTALGRAAESTRIQIVESQKAANAYAKEMNEASNPKYLMDKGISVVSKEKLPSTAVYRPSESVGEDSSIVIGSTKANNAVQNWDHVGNAGYYAVNKVSDAYKSAAANTASYTMAVTGATTAINNQALAAASSGAVAKATAIEGARNNVEYSAVVGSVGTAYKKTGISAAVAMGTGAAGVLTVKNLLKSGLADLAAFAGGWVGISIATGVAFSSMRDYFVQLKNERENNKFIIGGKEFYTDAQGKKVFGLNSDTPWNAIKTQFGYGTEVTDQDTISQVQDAYDKKRADDIKEESERQKRMYEKYLKDDGSSMFGGTDTEAIKKMIDQIMSKYGIEDPKAAKKAQQIADANQKYANIISQNADKIAKANEKISSILDSLAAKDMEIVGTQHEIDLAQLKKEDTDLRMQIAKTTVTLATVSPSVARLATGYTGSSGETGSVVDIISSAAKQLGFDNIPLALAVAEQESSLNPYAHNPNSSATGLFEILDGQDVASDNGRVAISDLYPDYKTDTMQNALAGITMLIDKINAAGDTWEGVKNYGEGTDEYMNEVKSKYDAIVGGNAPVSASTLTSTSYTTYSPDKQKEAYANEEKYIADKRALLDWQQDVRVRKQIEQLRELNIENAPGDNRSALIQAQLSASQAEDADKFRDLRKASGSDDMAKQVVAALQKKDSRDSAEKQFDLQKTQFGEQSTTISNQGFLWGQTQDQIDLANREALQKYIAVLEEERDAAQDNADLRYKIEQELVSKQKELYDLNGKNFEGGLEELYNKAKAYQVDYGKEMVSAFESITGDITNAFQNLLTKNESIGKRLSSMFVSIANDILNSFMKIFTSGLVSSAISQAFGMNSTSNQENNLYNIYKRDSSNVGYGLSSVSTGGSSSFIDSLLTSAATSFAGSYFKRASGGYVDGTTLVGEKGPELVDLKGGAYVYNASRTASTIGTGNAKSGGMVPVTLSVKNNSNTQLKTTKTSATFDGKELLVETIMDAAVNNYSGFGDFLSGLAGG